MTKEELLKKFDNNFMNNSLSGVLPDNYQDQQMLIIKKFVDEAYDEVYKAGYKSGYDQGYMSYHMEQI